MRLERRFTFVYSGDCIRSYASCSTKNKRNPRNRIVTCVYTHHFETLIYRHLVAAVRCSPTRPRSFPTESVLVVKRDVESNGDKVRFGESE
nr:hypothetical protein Q903MT_gene803 [Picea sitchensis]